MKTKEDLREMIDELRKISDNLYNKKHYVSASKINRAIDVIWNIIYQEELTHKQQTK